MPKNADINIIVQISFQSETEKTSYRGDSSEAKA